MPKPTWWNPSYLGQQNGAVRGPVAMLLTHAMEKGVIVLTGSARGVLEQDDETGQKELLKALVQATSGQIALSGGPILGRGAYETWIVWPEGTVIIEIGLDGKVMINAATTAEGPYVQIGEVIDTHLLPEHVRQPVYALTQSQGEIGISEVGSAGSALEAGNYSPEVVEAFNFIVEDLQRKEPFGRLVIVEGVPGSGKTWYLRGIINEVLDAVFILIPSHVIEDLAGPEMMPMLLKARGLAGTDKPLVLVIEDADRCLVVREKGNDRQMAAISALLNLSDGIMGQALDLRILTTTNAEVFKDVAADSKEGNRFDPALRRPGRLSKYIKIGPVSAEQAGEVYERITEGEEVTFEGPHTLAQIYAQAFMDRKDEDSEDDDEDEFEDDDEEDLEEDDEEDDE